MAPWQSLQSWPSAAACLGAIPELILRLGPLIGWISPLGEHGLAGLMTGGSSSGERALPLPA